MENVLRFSKREIRPLCRRPANMNTFKLRHPQVVPPVDVSPPTQHKSSEVALMQSAIKVNLKFMHYEF